MINNWMQSSSEYQSRKESVITQVVFTLLAKELLSAPAGTGGWDDRNFLESNDPQWNGTGASFRKNSSGVENPVMIQKIISSTLKQDAKLIWS